MSFGSNFVVNITMVVQFYDKHAKRQAGIHAAELGSPQRTARHSGWASAKKAESYYTKLSGPKVCQTHRSGRVMLILCKGWTFCSSFALWHQNIIHRVNSRKWTQTYKCNLSEEREIVLSLTCKSQRAGIPWRHEKVGKKHPFSAASPWADMTGLQAQRKQLTNTHTVCRTLSAEALLKDKTAIDKSALGRVIHRCRYITA